MEILKLGSKGVTVKLLQQKLNITADGIFGQDTEKAVKLYQSKHNLTPDGIVGQKTWNSLNGNIVAPSSKCVADFVIYDPLTVNIVESPNRPIKYLAIHYTCSGNSKPGKAKATKKVFETRKKASADFCVDDRDIIQFNPDLNNYYCYAVGDDQKYHEGGATLKGKATNKNTISIEICSTNTSKNFDSANHSGWCFTKEALNNAEKLAKFLIKKYNIPVVRHYDITGKNCPGIIGWNDAFITDVNTGKRTGEKNNSNKWLEFKEKLSSYK